MRIFLTDGLWRGSFYDRGLRRSRVNTDLFCLAIRFEIEEVVHWMTEILFAAKIAFMCCST